MIGQILSYTALSRTATVLLEDGSIISPPVDVDLTAQVGKSVFYEAGLLLIPNQPPALITATDPAIVVDGMLIYNTTAGIFKTGSGGVWVTAKHNALDSLQGGAAGEYYHLTSDEYTSKRETLTGNRTYYVRTDGSDSNDGLANTSGGAFLTIQKAVDVTTKLDLKAYTVTIQVADGTYTGGVIFSVPFVGGTVIIQGNNGTPANVVINPTSASCFYNQVNQPAPIVLKDMELRTTTSGQCIYQDGGGDIQFSNIRFGACANNHMYCTSRYGRIYAIGNYAVVGNAVYNMAAIAGSIYTPNMYVTISASLTFTLFAYATRAGYIHAVNVTYSSNVATATRFASVINAVIFTNGAAATLFPGNVAGYTDGFGFYG